jgi:beta-lactamase regulating signal transducer with metallopeptidase domain
MTLTTLTAAPLPAPPASPVLFLDHLASSFGAALIESSWQAALLALATLLLCLLLRDLIPAHWRCLLWLIVFARLALPWTPPSPISLFNIAHPWWTQPAPSTTSPATPRPFFGWVSPQQLITHDGPDTTLPTRDPQLSPALQPTSPTPSATLPPPVATAPPLPALRIVLASLWLLGVITVLTLLLAGHLRLRSILRQSRLLADPDAAALTEHCRDLLRVPFPLTLTENAKVQTPLVLGVIRPTLILPEGLSRRLSEEELRDVLLHELAHVKRHDILISWLMSLILALHWFNPLAWIAASRWRAERELACDELALHALAAPDRPRYGRTLLKLVEHAAFPRALPSPFPSRFPAVSGIIENNADLKRRIAMIAGFRPRSRATGIAAGALVALALAASLTNAQSRAQPRAQGNAPAAPQPAAQPTSPFRQGTSDVRLYTHAYQNSKGKDSSGRAMWTLPKGATLEVLPEYRGVGEKGEQFLDRRITIVLQDQTNSFWAMIASLETDDARIFRDELDKAIPERTRMLPRIGKKPDDAEVKPARIVSSEPLGEFGEIDTKFPMRPAISGRTLSEPILITLSSVPPGAELRSDIEVELTVPQAQRLASALTTELGRRGVAKAIDAAGRPTTSGPVTGRDIIADHFMFPHSGIRTNEFGVLLLPPRATFTVTADEPAPGGVDFRTVITLADDFKKVALISRVPIADALALANEIKRLAAEKRAAGALPGNGDSNIVVAPQIYKQDNAGMAHVAGLSFMALPGYSGIGQDNQRITDDRITLIINDQANGFWPLVARLDLATAEKLAADIAAPGKAQPAAAPKPGAKAPANRGISDQTFEQRTTRVTFADLDDVPGRANAQYTLPPLHFRAARDGAQFVTLSMTPEANHDRVIIESRLSLEDARTLAATARSAADSTLTLEDFAKKFEGMKPLDEILRSMKEEEARRGTGTVGSVNIRTRYSADSDLLPTDPAGRLSLGDPFTWHIDVPGTLDSRTVLSLNNPDREWVIDIRLLQPHAQQLAQTLEAALR